jgi:hypothetical protein
MNIEHIEWQMVAALVYLVYTLIMLAGKRTIWQKRKTVLIGFSPALLAVKIFMVQFLLEFIYMDSSIPGVLTLAFSTFYANTLILAMTTGLIAVVYLVLPTSGRIVQELAETAKKSTQHRVNSENNCIDIEEVVTEKYGGYWGTGYGATGYEGTGYRNTGYGG